MAVRSRDFVGIAEGIRSHELSTKSLIENLKGHMSELSGRRRSLNSTISYLEAAIAAAYEDTDEDGDPDYGLIASLEAEKSSAENELSGVEHDIDSTDSELESKQNELEAVEEEKAQTLFEIQERARKTSNNISLAGGMYGAYAGVGGALQNSLQTSLSSLTQAAGILGGSVDGFYDGSSGGLSGAGNLSSGGAGTNLGEMGSHTGPLSAFTGGYSGEALPLSVSQFSTNQDHLSTPATMPNYHSGQGSINTRAPQNFSTEQGANEYALSSFGDVTAPQVTSQSTDGYISNQASQNMERQFASPDFSTPGASSSSPGSRQHSFADWLNPENYQNGHYIGEGQSWGYKPYGNDTSEYSATIKTPEQQALSSYMQAHNYGKSDYATYSKDAEWQHLHKAAHPSSGVVDSLQGTTLALQHLTEYMYAHNYTQADFATFSRDAEWQRLHQMAYPDSGVVAALVGSELAKQHLRDYMYEHNYGPQDFSVYSKDSEWQRLHRNAYPENYSPSGHFSYGGVTQPSHIQCTTDIDSSVKDLPTLAKLSHSLKETFANGKYRTVVAVEDITLYRVYGGASSREGTFLTSQKPADRIVAKMGLALKAEWKNSRENFSEVIVPKGTILHIGKAAPQITASGYVLPGGMDQIIINREYIKEHPEAFSAPQTLEFKTGYKEFEQKAKAIEAQAVKEKKPPFGTTGEPAAKLGYKQFEKKVREIEDQIKKDEHDFLTAVLHDASVKNLALEEFTENFSDLSNSVAAYTEVCWLPKEHELPLAMAKADMLSSGLNTALISICLLAKAVKDKITK